MPPWVVPTSAPSVSITSVFLSPTLRPALRPLADTDIWSPVLVLPLITGPLPSVSGMFRAFLSTTRVSHFLIQRVALTGDKHNGPGSVWWAGLWQPLQAPAHSPDLFPKFPPPQASVPAPSFPQNSIQFCPLFQHPGQQSPLGVHLPPSSFLLSFVLCPQWRHLLNGALLWSA